jgi:hypothetical protein
MWRREAAPAPSETPTEHVQVTERPATVGNRMPAAYGATFAERRAASPAAAQAPRLASLGVHPTYLEARGRTKAQRVDVEYFVDLAHSARHYRRVLPHGLLEPLFSTEVKETIEDLGTTSPSLQGWRSGNYPDAAPETVTELKPAESRQLARPESSAYPDSLPAPPPRPV